jgi:hypothetical protein
MSTAAIITTIIGWLIFIGGLSFCFSRIGKGGEWED